MSVQALVETETVTVTTNAAGAGIATGNTTTSAPQSGWIYAIDIDYGSAPATTVVTFSAIAGAADGTDRTLFVVAAGNTDGLKLPRIKTQKAADGVDAGSFENVPISGRYIKATVTLADNANVVKIRYMILR
jgi:hypothetical protein